MKCDKCNENINGGSTYVQGGTSYSFCKLCSDIIDTCADKRVMIEQFLRSDEEQGKVMKEIFDAKKRRCKGKSWS